MNPDDPARAALGFEDIDFAAAAARIAAQVKRTPLLALPCEDERIELRGKMEDRSAVPA